MKDHIKTFLTVQDCLQRDFNKSRVKMLSSVSLVYHQKVPGGINCKVMSMAHMLECVLVKLFILPESVKWL